MVAVVYTTVYMYRDFLSGKKMGLDNLNASTET